MKKLVLVRLWLVAIALALVPSAAIAERDPLAEALALPVAGGLAGARDAPRFAWIVNEAGVRNIWVATRGTPARRLTEFAEDDGQELSDLAFSNDGASLAFVRGGDEEYPDQEDLPNTDTRPFTPNQQVFLVSANAGEALTVGQGHSPSFAPDGERLAFTRRGEIWIWTRGSEARRIAKVSGSIGRLTWAPTTELTRVDFPAPVEPPTTARRGASMERSRGRT